MSISLNNVESRVTALENIKSNSDLVLLASPKIHYNDYRKYVVNVSESFKNFYFLIIELDATAHTKNCHAHVIPTVATCGIDKGMWNIGDAFGTGSSSTWAGLSFSEKESSDSQMVFYIDNASLMNVFGYMRKTTNIYYIFVEIVSSIFKEVISYVNLLK